MYASFTSVAAVGSSRFQLLFLCGAVIVFSLFDPIALLNTHHAIDIAELFNFPSMIKLATSFVDSVAASPPFNTTSLSNIRAYVS